MRKLEKGAHMGVVYQKDSRSGITYVYESVSTWNKELKQSRAKRRLIGRLDPETGDIIPTDGRCKKRSPYYKPSDGTDELNVKCMKKAELIEEVQRLRKENLELKEKITALADKE